MKQFIIFVKKEFAHVLRDRKDLAHSVRHAIMQILIFGFALTNEVKNSKIVIVDHAKDIASQQIITRIEASRYFEIEKSVMNHQANRRQLFKKERSSWLLFSLPISIMICCIRIKHRSRSLLMHQIRTLPIH